MAVGNFERSVFQTGGVANKPHSCLIISIRPRGASSWSLQLDFATRPSPPGAGEVCHMA